MLTCIFVYNVLHLHMQYCSAGRGAVVHRIFMCKHLSHILLLYIYINRYVVYLRCVCVGIWFMIVIISMVILHFVIIIFCRAFVFVFFVIVFGRLLHVSV